MSADIDIDFADRDKILQHLKYTAASQVVDGQIRRHNSGIYVTDIPVDPINQCAAVDYQQAEQRGYFKLDFLNMSVYQLIRDPAHYDAMIQREPPWSRLQTDRSFVERLTHIGNHCTALQRMPEPIDSVPRMAAFISIIRPGKMHLQGLPWKQVFESVWDGDDSKGYTFKKAHAVSYAALVALHMNLLDTE
jgi:hypothetical protein